LSFSIFAQFKWLSHSHLARKNKLWPILTGEALRVGLQTDYYFYGIEWQVHNFNC
jgi:hypothetical protein